MKAVEALLSLSVPRTPPEGEQTIKPQVGVILKPRSLLTDDDHEACLIGITY